MKKDLYSFKDMEKTLEKCYKSPPQWKIVCRPINSVGEEGNFLSGVTSFLSLINQNITIPFETWENKDQNYLPNDFHQIISSHNIIRSIINLSVDTTPTIKRNITKTKNHLKNLIPDLQVDISDLILIPDVPTSFLAFNTVNPLFLIFYRTTIGKIFWFISYFSGYQFSYEYYMFKSTFTIYFSFNKIIGTLDDALANNVTSI